jgi:hypothetical protein
LLVGSGPADVSGKRILADRPASDVPTPLYPDPEAQELREALAVHHGIKPEQVVVGNGSDEVLAHAFVALLKQPGLRTSRRVGNVYPIRLGRYPTVHNLTVGSLGVAEAIWAVIHASQNIRLSDGRERIGLDEFGEDLTDVGIHNTVQDIPSGPRPGPTRADGE